MSKARLRLVWRVTATRSPGGGGTRSGARLALYLSAGPAACAVGSLKSFRSDGLDGARDAAGCKGTGGGCGVNARQ